VVKVFDVACRDYDAESGRKETVEEFYRVNHIQQTHEFVTRMRGEYGRLDRTEMGVWECIELLNEFVDDSDPDLDMPQIEHLLQTAEAIRQDYPDQDWLHLTGLIHGASNSIVLVYLLPLPGVLKHILWLHLTGLSVFQTWARCCCIQALGSSHSGRSLVSVPRHFFSYCSADLEMPLKLL
jgi:hypothetical protein